MLGALREARDRLKHTAQNSARPSGAMRLGNKRSMIGRPFGMYWNTRPFPSPNVAEQALRHWVIARKISPDTRTPQGRVAPSPYWTARSPSVANAVFRSGRTLSR